MDFRKSRGLSYFQKVIWIQWPPKSAEVLPLFSVGLKTGLCRTWDGNHLQPDPPQKHHFCVSLYSLSTASSKHNLHVDILLGKNQQRYGKYNHCVIYRATNVIYINTNVVWCRVNSCSGQLSKYFDTLRLTTSSWYKALFLKREKERRYAKLQVHLSRIILHLLTCISIQLNKITANSKLINAVIGNYSSKE